MKRRYDMGDHADQPHYQLKEAAKKLAMSVSAARKLFRADPRVRYLPLTPGPGPKRRTMIIPDEVLRDTYAKRLII